MFRSMLTLIAALVLAGGALAQEWPAKPVRFIVTFTQGGAADLTARILGDKLSEVWKQQVVVENRGGGNGTIGVEAVMRAAPDGYTFLLRANSHVINVAIQPKLSYDFDRDFAPVVMVTAAPLLMVANPRFAAKNLDELTAQLRARPGKIDVVTCGVATVHHLAMELYKHATKTFAVHIPQRGCTPAVVDVVAGVVDVGMVSLPAGLPFVRQGKLTAIAITSKERSHSAPEIPTFRESKAKELARYEIDNYYGFMAPRGTPAEILAKLEADTRRVLEMADVQKRIAGAGMDPFVLGPQDMVKLMRADVEKFKQTIRAANIQPE